MNRIDDPTPKEPDARSEREDDGSATWSAYRRRSGPVPVQSPCGKILHYRDLLFFWCAATLCGPLQAKTILGPIWFVLQPVNE